MVSARVTLSSFCERSAATMDETRAQVNEKPSRRLRERARATLMMVITLPLAASRQLLLALANRAPPTPLLLLPLALVNRARPIPLLLLEPPLPPLLIRPWAVNLPLQTPLNRPAGDLLFPSTRLDLFQHLVSESVLINLCCLQRRGRKRALSWLL